MEITAAHKQKMLAWIKNVMIIEKWYPIQSDAAFETIKALFLEGKIDECELDSKELNIRKVILDYPRPPYYKEPQKQYEE